MHLLTSGWTFIVMDGSETIPRSYAQIKIDIWTETKPDMIAVGKPLVFFDLICQADAHGKQYTSGHQTLISEAPACEKTSLLHELVYPTQPLSNMAGTIRQYAICYKCGLNEKEIVKTIKCVICEAKKRTLFMVACQEIWPPRAERVAQKCYRCLCARPDRSSSQQCIYTITSSSQIWGNRPVCCDCYMVPVPCRHIPISS